VETPPTAAVEDAVATEDAAPREVTEEAWLGVYSRMAPAKVEAADTSLPVAAPLLAVT